MKLHPFGRELHEQDLRCGDCAWARKMGPGPKVLRCIAAFNQRIDPRWRACSGWEAELDCLDCGACCGPAYHAVEVQPRDPVRKKHPDFIRAEDGRFVIRRSSENYCSALQSDNRCEIYADRPRCCRDFEKGSGNCLFARRRMGLSSHWNVQ